jgi:hypothetical protein
MVQGVRGIETGLAGHGEHQPSTACCTWQRPVFQVAAASAPRRAAGSTTERKFTKATPCPDPGGVWEVRESVLEPT